MINIVCLKWGDKFSSDYVNHLFLGIERNTTVPFRFHCFTEDKTDILPNIECHALPDLDITGWWYKLWLFSDDMPFDPGERIMFFDLDTIVTGNIDNILEYDCPAGIVGLRNFYRPNRFASGLLMWLHGSQTHVWQRFLLDPQQAQKLSPDGDQEWTEQNIHGSTFWQTEFPDCIYSYKQSCSKGLPENASIVCYHGTPSIVESFTKTVKNYDGLWHPQEWPKLYWRS